MVPGRGPHPHDELMQKIADESHIDLVTNKHDSQNYSMKDANSNEHGPFAAESLNSLWWQTYSWCHMHMA